MFPLAIDLRPIPVRRALPVYRAADRKMGQLVTVNPRIDVSVNTGIEQYLFPIGLMAGGGATFVLGSAVPPSIKPITTVAGLALLASGVGVLLYRGMKGSAPAPAPGAPASGGVPVTSQTPPPAYQPAPQDAFRSIQIAVASPQSGQTISSSGGFLGLGSKSIPVQLQMYNPSPVDVTFNLNFSWDELPSLVGYDRGRYRGTQSFQVTLAAGQVQNQTFSLPIQADVSWSQMQADLQVYTQRTPQENQQLLSNLTFTVV